MRSQIVARILTNLQGFGQHIMPFVVSECLFLVSIIEGPHQFYVNKKQV